MGGWVRREVRLSDRRTNFVFLTQQSLDLLRGMQSVEKMLNRRVLKGLTGVERDLIAELLGLLRVNLVDSLSAEGDIPAMIESLDLFRSINKQDRK